MSDVHLHSTISNFEKTKQDVQQKHKNTDDTFSESDVLSTEEHRTIIEETRAIPSNTLVPTKKSGKLPTRVSDHKNKKRKKNLWD